MVNFLQYILAGLASFQNTGISPSFFSLVHLLETLWKKRNERLDLFTKEMWERKGRVREWTEIEAKEAVLWLDILKFPLLVSTTKLVFVRSLSLFSFFQLQRFSSRDGTLVGYTFSKRYKKVSPHRKSHNLLYNLLKEKNKPPQEMVNKRGVPFGPTWLTRTLAVKPPIFAGENEWAKIPKI